ncbi:MAG: hypothetical protein Q9178_001637 [Gyalolechia marmorata]
MSKIAGVRGIRDATKRLSLNPVKPTWAIKNARCASSEAEQKPDSTAKLSSEPVSSDEEQKTPKKKKTMAELDEELRMKMEGKSGEGGEAGLELEDGRPAAMKRGVKNNMFRLI